MSFSTFLKQIRTRYNIDSISDLYEFLGGRENLNMGQRNLAMLDSGDLKPTISFLAGVTRKLQPHEYKDALLAFCESNLDSDLDADFLGYLKNNLTSLVNNRFIISVGIIGDN